MSPTGFLAGPISLGGQTITDKLGDLVWVRLSPRLDLGEDQIAVHSDLVHASTALDQVHRLDLIAKFLLQLCRYTSGYGFVASRSAVANLDLHLVLLQDLVIAGFYHTRTQRANCDQDLRDIQGGRWPTLMPDLAWPKEMG